jgi:hypothetical protein
MSPSSLPFCRADAAICAYVARWLDQPSQHWSNQRRPKALYETVPEDIVIELLNVRAINKHLGSG